MSKSTLIIPIKCKVGFQERKGTYTGLLAYVIMWDGKKWRKENSWNSWRYTYISDEDFQKEKEIKFKNRILNETIIYNKTKEGISTWQKETIDTKTLKEWLEYKKINSLDSFEYSPYGKSNNEKIIPKEFDNVSTEGFVLNKKAGGYSSGWNHRSTYIRVYDPRGWEFEISPDNLLYILQETNSIKGKGLEGEFVYSWSGKDLVLLPTSTIEYKESLEHTKIQKNKFYKKDMVEGATYLDSNSEEMIYLGHYKCVVNGWRSNSTKIQKKYLFGKQNYKGIYDYTELYSSLNHVKKLVSIDIHPEFNNLLDEFLNSKRSESGIKEIIYENITQEDLPSYCRYDTKQNQITVYKDNKAHILEVKNEGWIRYSNVPKYYINNTQVDLSVIFTDYKKKVIIFKNGNKQTIKN